MSGVAALLADLVAIPSMNPMGRDRTGSMYGEAALADYVATFLRKNRIDVEVYDVHPGRPNVVARVTVGAPTTVLLEAHLDTVHADNMSIDPFRPDMRGGRLYGRGSCDTKGSLAAFLAAVTGLLAGGTQPAVNLVLLAVADEEYRFTGAQAAVARGLTADWGIAGEPTQLRIVRAHKGVTRWKIVTRGVAAHSAYPERGRNAINAMGRVLVHLEEYAGSLSDRTPHPDLGKPTLSVGVIEGGQAVNIVPDRCWIEVDRRTLPGEDRAAVLAPVAALLRGIPDAAIEEPHIEVPGMEVAASAPPVVALSRSLQAITGAAVIETAHYATDAGVYNRHGIPTVVFGPGDIALAHTADESIGLGELETAVRVLERMIA
jgi:acetylornithine deacetylase